MKKYILRYCVLVFAVFFVVTFFVRMVFIPGDNEISESLLISTMNSVIFVSLYGALIYYDMKPKIRFLTSTDINYPGFGSKSEFSFPVDSELFSFSEIVSLIQNVYAIDFIDVNEGILKFHTKKPFRHYHLGCFVYFDMKFSVVKVYCFPFSGGFTSRTSAIVSDFCKNLKSEIIIKLGI